jgi:hypothetical protein
MLRPGSARVAHDHRSAPPPDMIELQSSSTNPITSAQELPLQIDQAFLAASVFGNPPAHNAHTTTHKHITCSQSSAMLFNLLSEWARSVARERQR